MGALFSFWGLSFPFWGASAPGLSKETCRAKANSKGTPPD
jgi:hypothetical protein